MVDSTLLCPRRFFISDTGSPEISIFTADEWRKWGAPHFRHSRAIHLYRGGMPLPLLSEWLGHAQIETTMIYANADTKMKKDAIEKATSKLNPLITDQILIEWEKDEETIKKLYGLV